MFEQEIYYTFIHQLPNATNGKRNTESKFNKYKEGVKNQCFSLHPFPILLSPLSGFMFVCIPRWLSGKESACQAGDSVGSRDPEDSLEEGMTTHSPILTWEIPQSRSLSDYSPQGCKESDRTQCLNSSSSILQINFPLLFHVHVQFTTHMFKIFY